MALVACGSNEKRKRRRLAASHRDQAAGRAASKERHARRRHAFRRYARPRSRGRAARLRPREHRRLRWMGRAGRCLFRPPVRSKQSWVLTIESTRWPVRRAGASEMSPWTSKKRGRFATDSCEADSLRALGSVAPDEAVFVQFLDERGARDSQPARRFALVFAGGIELGGDDASLERLDPRAQGMARPGVARGDGPGPRAGGWGFDE